MGVSENYLDIRQWSLASGTFFTDRDEKTRNKVAVLGKTVADQLFGEQEPIGADIRIRSVPFKVIGVLSAKGQSANGADQDDIVLAPALTVFYRLSKARHLNSIMTTAVSEDKMDAAKQEIQTLLRETHRLQSGAEDDLVMGQIR
jgi:putative ABC transport system permease protein